MDYKRYILKVYFENLLRIKMMECSTFSYITLRISNPYGGDQDITRKQGIIPILINKAYSEETLELWVNRSTTRDFIHIDDLLEATNQIIHKCNVSGDELNVGSGRGTSLDTLIQLVEESVGKKIEIVNKSAVTTVINSNILDITKVKEMVGFTPKISILEGIDRLVNQMKR